MGELLAKKKMEKKLGIWETNIRNEKGAGAHVGEERLCEIKNEREKNVHVIQY